MCNSPLKSYRVKGGVVIYLFLQSLLKSSLKCKCFLVFDKVWFWLKSNFGFWVKSERGWGFWSEILIKSRREHKSKKWYWSWSKSNSLLDISKNVTLIMKKYNQDRWNLPRTIKREKCVQKSWGWYFWRGIDHKN